MARRKHSKSKYLSYSDVMDLTESEKLAIYNKESQKANMRLLQLERNNITNYVYKQASQYNVNELDRNSNRFYVGKKLDSDALDYALQQVLSFNRAVTSTVKGHTKDLENKRRLFERDVALVQDSQLANFSQFLYSQQFKTLRGMVDSNQVLEDFNQAMDEGFTVKQIMRQYEKFITTDMTFEQVAERRQRNKRGLK